MYKVGLHRGGGGGGGGMAAMVLVNNDRNLALIDCTDSCHCYGNAVGISNFAGESERDTNFDHDDWYNICSFHP